MDQRVKGTAATTTTTTPTPTTTPPTTTLKVLSKFNSFENQGVESKMQAFAAYLILLHPYFNCNNDQLPEYFF